MDKKITISQLFAKYGVEFINPNERKINPLVRLHVDRDLEPLLDTSALMEYIWGLKHAGEISEEVAHELTCASLKVWGNDLIRLSNNKRKGFR